MRISHATNATIHQWCTALSVSLVLFVAPLVASSDPYIPDVLEPWENWVRDKHTSLDCPFDAVEGTRLDCGWFGYLEVDVKSREERRISFVLTGRAYADTPIPLPFAKSRPFEVSLNGENALLGSPHSSAESVVYVAAGDFTIRGTIAIEDALTSLNIPPRVAIVRLIVDGMTIAQPRFEEGRLWLTERQAENEESTNNTERVSVFRKLIDTIPQQLETRIEVIVDGVPRNLDLGQVLPVGFRVIRVRSDAPLQLGPENNFIAQVKPGRNVIRIRSINHLIGNEFSALQASETWPNFEIWAIEPSHSHRVVAVSGVTSVEPTLVGSPFGNVANYRVNHGDALLFENEVRGEVRSGSIDLVSNRSIWLSFEGDFFTVVENLEVNSTRQQRIQALQPIGNVTVNGSPSMVASSGRENDLPGITLVGQNSSIRAESTLESGSNIPAVGWDQDASKLNIRLNLPPGWHLIHAWGVDIVQQSWVSQWWSLWDIFLCVLIVIVLYRLAGAFVAVLAGLALLLGYHEQWWTSLGWLTLALLGLLRTALGEEKFKRTLQFSYWSVFIVVAVGSILVAVNNVRQAVYLQLETHDRSFMAAQANERTESLQVSGNFPESVRMARQQSTGGKSVDKDSQGTRSGGSVLEAFRYPVIQTGPGEPNWSWRSETLRWTGPVTKDETFSLVLMPPILTRVVYLAVAGLHLIFLLFFISVWVDRKWQWPSWLIKLLPFLLISLAASNVQANFPGEKLLSELENRITAAPTCLPHCATLNRVKVSATEADELLVNLIWSATESVAVPIPNSSVSSSLQSAQLDGEDLSLRADSARTLAVLPRGNSELTLRFNLTNLDQFTLEFPFDPALVEHDLCCWQSTEVREQSRLLIIFNRDQESSSISPEAGDTYLDIPPHTNLTVTRRIILGYEPTVITEVSRQGYVNTEKVFQLPMLPGETLLNSTHQAEDGVTSIVFPAGSRDAYWGGSLELRESLTLRSPADGEWTERWILEGSNFWKVSVDGVPESERPSDDIGAHFHPRAGESLSLSFESLAAVEGQTVTIEELSLSINPGVRSSTGVVKFVVRAGTADELTVTLPPSSRVQRLLKDGDQVIAPSTNELTVPVVRGITQYRINFESDDELSMFYRTPEVRLSNASNNIDIALNYPRNRWILMLGGPTIGVAILFWGVLIVTVVVAWVLALLPNFPLTKVDAILLAAGATLANIWSLLIVGAWLVSIWWRARTTLDALSNSTYRLSQIGLFSLAGVGVIALFLTVFSALLTPADMFLVQSPLSELRFFGSGAENLSLHWYSDFAEDVLPRAWVISLPFWFYQLTMLAWSLWLVFALIRWIKTTFTTLFTPSLWRTEDVYAPDTPILDSEDRDSASDHDDDTGKNDRAW